MKKYYLLFVLLFFSVAMITSSQSDFPTLDNLEDGWNSIETDGVCSTGTPYHFLVNASDTSDDLLIFFDGGGACWNGQLCDLNSQPNVHSPFADETPEAFTEADGVFDLDNEDNPFADYSMVFLPYCTGDVFIGAGEREYTYTNAEGEETTVTTYHTGYDNTVTVLDWVYDNFDSPDSVLIAGSSAGAIGSSFYAGFVAENYADVPVVLMADAAGGYNSVRLPFTFKGWNTVDILPDWETYAGKDSNTLTFEDFYIASALHADNLTISQFNTAYDETQIGFSVLLGDAPNSFDLPSRIMHHYQEIESAVDEFYSYTAGGDQHTIMSTPFFYTYTVEGVRFVDWLAALVAGETVDDISCVDEMRGCTDAPDA